jgi:acyl carrier protein
MGNSILDRVTETARMIFDNDDLVLTRDTTAKDVEGWDSVTHINLIVALEREFKIKFTTSEVMSMKNVGELSDLIARKTA